MHILFPASEMRATVCSERNNKGGKQRSCIEPLKIKPPFLEIGSKAYLYGEEMLRLTKEIDRATMKYHMDIIVTPQYMDIRLLAEKPIDRELAPLCMLEMRAKHITGKAAIELVRASQAQKNFPEG